MNKFLVLSAVLALAIASPLDKDEEVELLEARDPDYPAGPADAYGPPQGPGGFRGEDGGYRPQDDFNPFGFAFGRRPSFEGPPRGFNDFFDWITNVFRGPFRFPGGMFDYDDSVEHDMGKLPADYDNSTYHTQVVNGSLVAINETTKRHKTNNTSFFFHSKTIQVLPQNASEVASPPKPAATSGTGDAEQELPADQTLPPANQESNDVNTGRRTR